MSRWQSKFVHNASKRFIPRHKIGHRPSHHANQFRWGTFLIQSNVKLILACNLTESLFFRPCRKQSCANRSMFQTTDWLYRLVALKSAKPAASVQRTWLVGLLLCFGKEIAVTFTSSSFLWYFLNSGYKIEGPFEGEPSKIEFTINEKVFTTTITKGQKGRYANLKVCNENDKFIVLISSCSNSMRGTLHLSWIS